MKVLVIGGNGFIGTHLVDRLIELKYDVRVLDRCAERLRQPLSQVEYQIGDYQDAKLSLALEGVDCVFHLVSTTVPGTSNQDIPFDIHSNLIGSITLFQKMCEHGIKRIIFLSSGGTVYGEPHQPLVSEEHPLEPICSYGVVKVAIENYLRMFERLYGFQAVIIRPSNPYGPRQLANTGQGVIATFIDKVKKQSPIEVWGDGSVKRDFIYVTDLVNLIINAAESNKSITLNAASGYAISINEIIQKLELVTNQNADVNYSGGRSFDVKEIALDISKANSELGWKPQVDIETGLRRMFNSIQ